MASINTLTCLDYYINSTWLQCNSRCTCAARLSCVSVYISPLHGASAPPENTVTYTHGAEGSAL